jgi:ATP-dependent Clp protease ATP-binding subunit ClpX
MGFEAEIHVTNDEEDTDKIISMVQPEDLIKYGLIPEFIGRIPILATLNTLSEDALVRILTEPKNALSKQYKKLFEVEGVELKFSEEAYRAVARDAIGRKSGARGLRAILESVMLDIMYDIPSMPGVQECVIEENVITKGESPLLIYENKDKAGYA